MFWAKCSLCRFVWRQLLLTAALLLSAAVISATLNAQTYTVLHNFTGGADGHNPQAGLTLNGTSNLFGAGNDTVFRLRQSGMTWLLSPIFDFNGTDGAVVTGRLTFGPGGALYGGTFSGGIPNCYDGAGCGLIFSMRPTSSICRSTSCPWTMTALYQFDPLSRPSDGYSSQGGLVFDSAGNIYGTTSSGGLNGGVVFELCPSGNSWTETILHSFGGPDGYTPTGNMVIDRAGNIIGTTQFGGNGGNCAGEGCGVIFELTHTSSGWVESTLHNFNPSEGALPTGGLISDAAGNLYGTTTVGGTNAGGTVYELTPSNGDYTYQTLYSSAGPGRYGPSGLLAIDSSGNLYGATNSQGAFSLGNIFKLTRSGGQWVYSDLHDFSGPQDGSYPSDGPTLDPSGNLYGTASEGGNGAGCPGGCGVVWEITP